MAQELKVHRGRFGYKAGTAPATVDVPAGARVDCVYLVAGGGGAATVVIAGGDTITVPASGVLDLPIMGATTQGADVVIGGTVASYLVTWAIA